MQPTLILGDKEFRITRSNGVLPRANLINTRTGQNIPDVFSVIGDNILTPSRKIIFDPRRNTVSATIAHYKKTHSLVSKQLYSLKSLQHRYRLASEDFLLGLRSLGVFASETVIESFSWRVGMIQFSENKYYLVPLFSLKGKSIKSVSLSQGSLETTFNVFLG